MKLTVYEDLPCTPLSACHDIVPRPFFSRALTLSRPTSRASFLSLRHRLSKQNPLASPQLASVRSCNDLPLRRRRDFRPLELSIYVDSNRLSDLPAFNRLSFTDFGEIKKDTDVLDRPQSAVVLSAHDDDACSIAEQIQKPVSMYELSSHLPSRPCTSGSVISTSRPPSEYDALHSHPVSWMSLPGLTITTQGHKSEKSLAVLTPVEDESPIEPSEVTVDGVILTFPSDAIATSSCDKRLSSSSSLSLASSNFNVAAPSPVVSRGSYHHRTQTSKSMDDVSPIKARGGRRMYKRSISQWLASRQRSTSMNSIASVSTTKSFIENHRKRTEFYQLGQQTALVDNTPTSQMLDMSANMSSIIQHKRTVTGSTVASTIDTEVSSQNDRFSTSTETWLASVNTTCNSRARSGTVKSITSPGGHKLVTGDVHQLGLATPMRGEVYIVDQELSYLSDIENPVHGPSVGVAY